MHLSPGCKESVAVVYLSAKQANILESPTELKLDLNILNIFNFSAFSGPIGSGRGSTRMMFSMFMCCFEFEDI